MANDIDRIEKLIDVDLLEAMFDEWMDTQFHTISASGDKIIVIDKKGTRTETNDLAAAAKTAKAEWDNTYKPQITSATSAATTAAGNANTAAGNASDKAALANTAAGNADTAAQGASNVNAQLSGMTVTITNRSGQSSSIDIGFEVYRTYISVAAMNADASNVPEGKFVMINSSTEDPDNAKLYSKNSQGGFTYLTDLSGAQGIKGDKGDTGDAAGFGTPTATVDSNIGTPSVEVTASGTDTAKVFSFAFHNMKGEKGDKGEPGAKGAKGDKGDTGVKGDKGDRGPQGEKGDPGYEIHLEDMTPAEQEELKDLLADGLVFASKETCREIVDELL